MDPIETKRNSMRARVRPRPVLAIVASLGLGGCGGADPYLGAAGQFATAASADTKALQGAVPFRQHLCEQSSQIEFVANSLARTNTTDGKLSSDTNSPVYWTQFYTLKPLVDGKPGPSREDTCKASAAADAFVAKLLGVVSGYADALQQVAGEDYSGGKFGTLVTDLGTLAGPSRTFRARTRVHSRRSGVRRSAPGPVAQVVGALEQHYLAGEVRRLVRAAAPSLQLILGGIASYVKAVNVQEHQWEVDTYAMLDNLEKGMTGRAPAGIPPAAPTPESPPPKAVDSTKMPKSKGVKVVEGPPIAAPVAPTPPAPHGSEASDPLALMEFYRFAHQWQYNAELTNAKQAALSAGVQDLMGAESALKSVADGGPGAPSLTDVLALVTQVLNDVAAVQSAIQGGATQ